jgi:nitroimidazol reductase NimA-like FMN-containing flavoprotein (pyridoxamine 5'-phosphate oxidase superfamily)
MLKPKLEVTETDEMIRIMTSTNVGRLATNGSDGYPYITPVNFVFFEGCVYFHSSPKGEKMDNIARDPRVCLTVDVPLAYLEVNFNPKKNPCLTSQLYHCVIIRGKARIVSEDELKTAALNALVAKHEGNADFVPVTKNSPWYKVCSVVEITPEKMTAALIYPRPILKKSFSIPLRSI